MCVFGHPASSDPASSESLSADEQLHYPAKTTDVIWKYKVITGKLNYMEFWN